MIKIIIKFFFFIIGILSISFGIKNGNDRLIGEGNFILYALLLYEFLEYKHYINKRLEGLK